MRIFNSSGDSEINMGLLGQSQGCRLSKLSVGSVRLCSWPLPADTRDTNGLPSIGANPSSPSCLTLVVMTTDSLVQVLGTGMPLSLEPLSCLSSRSTSSRSPSSRSLTLAFHSLTKIAFIMRQIIAHPFSTPQPLSLSSCFFPHPSLPPVLSNLKNGGFNSGSPGC